MKRTLALLLLLLLCLTGCTTPQVEEPPVSPPPIVSPTPTPTQTVEPAPTPTQTVDPSPTPTQTVEPTPTPPTPKVITFSRINFPRLDGSTSTAPLGQAIAAVLLGEPQENVTDLIQFSRTSQSFRQLMWGYADLLIVAEPSASVFESMDASGFEIQMEPFAHDGLIFVVNADNPVDSLTVKQLQGIYSGEITNWSQVGGDDLPITPFQRNTESGSQVLMEKLVMDGLTMLEPLDGYMLSEMGTLMEAVRSYENTASAIGYSVYYYANDMRMAEGLKILAVEGVTPSADTIRSGEYSLRNPYYVVKPANTHENSMTAILYDWILSEDGQRLVNLMGYASVLDVAAEPNPAPDHGLQVTVHWNMLERSQPETTLANRWYEEFTSDLIPSDEYGPLVPYIGGEISNPWWGNGWTYGLATLDGTIVTDAVFLQASYNAYYDNRSYRNVYPEPAVFELSKPIDGKLCYGLAAGDGSWYTGMIYHNVLYTTPEGSLMEELSGDVVMLNWSGQEVFRWPADRIPLPNFRPNNFMMHRGGFSGRWVRYIDYDDDWNYIYYYIDLRSGAVSDTQPADWDESEPYRPPNAITFGGGWYAPAGVGTPVELHLYSGETVQYPLPTGYKIRSVNGDRVLLYQGNSMYTCMLTDLEGNILVEEITDTPEFTTNYSGGTPSLIYSERYDPSYWHSWQLVRDRNGNELLTARDSSLHQFGSYLTFADDYYYRLTDLEGNDLIRIPRFTADD